MRLDAGVQSRYPDVWESFGGNPIFMVRLVAEVISNASEFYL